jgi:hypothetical protein
MKTGYWSRLLLSIGLLLLPVSGCPEGLKNDTTNGVLYNKEHVPAAFDKQPNKNQNKFGCEFYNLDAYQKERYEDTAGAEPASSGRALEANHP